MIDLKELAKKAYEERLEKVQKDDEVRKRIEEDEVQNVEKYVQQIVDIFIASNSPNERSVWGVRIDNSKETLRILVAYSPSEINFEKFFEEEDILDNNDETIEAIKKFNSENIKSKYAVKIMRYFKDNLSDYFLVSMANTIELKNDINLLYKS